MNSYKHLKATIVRFCYFRKWSGSSSSSSSNVASAVQAILATPPISSAPPSPQVEAVQAVATEEVDWTYDPNEPRYCICNQVSYGDMVACDNEDVRNIG